METQNEVHFTPRELQVIKLLLLCTHRKKIGIVLQIETGTVSNHFKHLFEKTETHSVSELVIYLFTHDFAIDKAGNVTYKGNVI